MNSEMAYFVVISPRFQDKNGEKTNEPKWKRARRALREFKKRRRPRQRQHHKTIISLVEREKIIVLHAFQHILRNSAQRGREIFNADTRPRSLLPNI